MGESEALPQDLSIPGGNGMYHPFLLFHAPSPKTNCATEVESVLDGADSALEVVQELT